MTKKRFIVISGLILLLLFIAACSEQNQEMDNTTADAEPVPDAEEAIVKGPEPQKASASGNAITGMVVAPATTVLPASSSTEQKNEHGVVFDVTDMTYNPYTLRGFTYTITNNLDRDLETTLDMYVEGEEEGTRLRIKKMDLVRVKPGESKTVSRDLNAKLVKTGVPQTIYFSIFEYTTIKGPVLATDEYTIAFS